MTDACMADPTGTATPYPLPRGTCPSCSSGEITHLIIGMPAGPDSGAGDPDWVAWVGCVNPGYTRRCEACGATWTPEKAFADLQALMIEAEVNDLEDLCGWLSSDYEFDAWVITDDEGYFEVGFSDRGVGIEFPILEHDFWETLDELHDEAEHAIESAGE